MKRLFAFSAVFLLLAAANSTAVQAQQGERNGRSRGNEKAGGGESAARKLDPAWLDKFDGMGRESDFQAAMKEERAGWRAMQQKDYDQAINRFKQASTLYPNLPLDYLAMGEAIERSGGPAGDAEKAYRTSIKMNTDNFRAWHKLAGILYQEKKYVEARKALADALQLNPPPKERRILERMVVTVEAGSKGGKVDTSE